MATVSNIIGDQSSEEGTPKIADTWIVKAVAAIRQRLVGRNHSLRRMQLIETLQLGGKRQLMLIVCDGQEYLVGAGSDSVHSIAVTFARPSAPDVMHSTMLDDAYACHRDSISFTSVQKTGFSR